MDDAKRFIRYVIPGIVFFIEVSFYLFISAKQSLIDNIQASELITSENSGISLTLAALLTSGGLGYIFGNIYYVFHCFSLGLVDHTELIKYAEKEKWISVVDKKAMNMNKNDAWRIVTSLWKSRIESSIRIKGIDGRMDSLADIMHGLGTSIVASLFAMLFWVYLHCSWTSTRPWEGTAIYALIISMLMVAVFIVNYILTKKNIQRIMYIILSEELQGRIEKPKEVVPNADKSKDDKPMNADGPVIIHY